jgi:glycopeptide antibiotics resistance protein
MALATNFNALALLVFGAVWVVLLVYLRLKRQKSALYLLFFTLFYFYLYKVLDYTLIQFQSLILLNLISPDLILSGYPAGEELNLVPLVTLTREEWETSFLNVLLFVPFGFGLPFIVPSRMARTVMTGMCFSVTIELLQFVTGRIAGISFRVTDVNDVIFNTAGAAIGYLLFLGFVRIVRAVVQSRPLAANAFVRYIVERPQVQSPT